MRDTTQSNRRRIPRWVWMGLIVLLVLGASPFVVTYYRSRNAERELQALLATYRARGEPVTATDLQPVRVPDEDNGAIDLKAAEAHIAGHESIITDLEPIALRLPWTEKEQATVEGVLKVYQPSLEKVRAARGKTGIDWGLHIGSPLVMVLLPDLSHVRELANRAAAACLLAHVQGRDVEALRCIDDIFYLARAADEMVEVMVCHVVSNGARAMALDKLRQITADLRIELSDGESLNPGNLQKLIAKLLDEKAVREGQRRGMLGERVFFVDSLESMMAGRFDPRTLGAGTSSSRSGGGWFFLRPKMLDDARLGAEYITESLAAAHAGDWPTAQSRRSRIRDDIHKHPARHPLAALLLPPERAMSNDFRLLTESRVTAITLAMRWYAVEHGERLPERLEELVPKYLPGILGDPMGAGAPPLRYLADGDDPRVYSVGSNGKDDGGSEAMEVKTRTPSDEYSPWEKLDAVFHYRGQPRTPTTKLK
jgi:hypothetical protein